MNAQHRLRELFLIPKGGWCNRMRAVASARRLCEHVGAELTLIWDWGEFSSFFQPIPNLRIEPPTGAPASNIAVVRHDAHCRTVDVTQERVLLKTCYTFGGSHEDRLNLPDVGGYIPKLNAVLNTQVDAFAESGLSETVGLHMRRTDQLKSLKHSPDELFIRAAREYTGIGKKLFLATDSKRTQSMMQRMFGSAIITFPKRDDLERRWPRAFGQAAAEDDLIELFILSRCECVLGSYWSTYSETAIYLNGSPKSRILTS